MTATCVILEGSLMDVIIYGSLMAVVMMIVALFYGCYSAVVEDDDVK